MLPYKFTVRQRQVLRRIGLGMTYGQIASELKISPNTVKAHASMLAARIGYEHLPTRSAIEHFLFSLASD